MNKRNLLLVCVVLLTAIPLMYFIAFLDPVRESVGMKTYLTCVGALTLTILTFRYFVKKALAEQLFSMRSDGLNEDEIRKIVGSDKYNMMLRATGRM